MNVSNIEDYLIRAEETAYKAYYEFNENKKDILVVVDENKKFLGVITRKEVRNISSDQSGQKVDDICNRNCFYVVQNDQNYIKEAKKFFVDSNVRQIPLIDRNKNVIDILDRSFVVGKIGFIIPEPVAGSGGHRTFLRIAKHFVQNGYEVELYIMPIEYTLHNEAEVREYINRYFFELNAKIIFGCESISLCDILIATFWKTAYILSENRSKAKLACYFIQEFEPYFMPMGYEYILAHYSYKLGLLPITYGPKVKEMLQKGFRLTEGIFLNFSVNRGNYYPCVQGKREKRILFFARPEMDRRCYPLGIDALKMIKERYPEMEICLYGAPYDRYTDVPFAFHNMGIISPAELGQLYRNSMIGICFSTTNPSLIPFEMMRCGLPVIDIDFNDNECNYGGRQNVILAEPTPEGVCREIEHMIEDEKLREEQSKRGIKFTESLLDDSEMESMLETMLMRKLREVDHEENGHH